jgi:hypothetical protein
VAVLLGTLLILSARLSNEIDAIRAAGVLRQAKGLFMKKHFRMGFGIITGNATEA